MAICSKVAKKIVKRSFNLRYLYLKSISKQNLPVNQVHRNGGSDSPPF
jgi:hypothetical protein